MYKQYEELIKNEPNVVIWGTGSLMKTYIKKIDPGLKMSFFADSDSNNWEKYPAKGIACSYENIPCKSKQEISEKDVVLIAIKNLQDIEKIESELEQKGTNYCHIIEAVYAYMPIHDNLQLKKYKEGCNKNLEYETDKIVKFVNCHVPYTNCNFKCDYCYIRQVRDFKKGKNYFHTPEFIRAALSKQRLGGVALINFCAAGETLMCKKLIPIIVELVKEGHYISIVTNGTITKAFDWILESGIDNEHIFIKFSFHYLELKKRKLLGLFVNNVIRMRAAGCSVTVELAPSDDLVPYINEIKEFSLNKLGALPHLTVTRDDRTDEISVLTMYDIGLYKKTWGIFNSNLFEYKMDMVGLKIHENCMAGKWSFQMDLETGDIYKCIGNPYLDNIYEDLCKDIYLEAVYDKCLLPYCYNCHAYLALGLVEEIEAPTYYEVRDRDLGDKSHWVQGKIANIFKQKLYENNKKEYKE